MTFKVVKSFELCGLYDKKTQNLKINLSGVAYPKYLRTLRYMTLIKPQRIVKLDKGKDS